MSENNTYHPKPERSSLERISEIISNARAEGVGQCGKNEVEGANEFQQFMISDFELTIYTINKKQGRTLAGFACLAVVF